MSQLNAALVGTHQQIYGLQRDHMKGFDHLLPEAFEDALTYYGLDDMIEFERARTFEFSLTVKSVDGISPWSIFTTGQTKQGDPLSPIKYTLSMSMQYRWFEALGEALGPGVVTVQTIAAATGDYPHTPADKIKLRIISVEAMDDSLMFARDIDTLQSMATYGEHFQSAYGIETSWPKSSLFYLGTPYGQGPQRRPFRVANTTQYLNVLPQPTILRTEFTNPQATLDKVLADVDRLPIAVDKRWPAAILLTAVKSLLLPTIRSRLALQSVPMKMAKLIDQAVSDKVMTAWGMQNTRSGILSIPINRRGFGFPSLDIINGELAINSVLRGLNHHLRPLSSMAAITLANLQCEHTGCAPPLLDPGFLGPKGAHGIDCVPVAWQTAIDYMKRARINIIDTDESKWKTDYSTAHVLSRIITEEADTTGRIADQLPSLSSDDLSGSFDSWLTKAHRLVFGGAPPRQAQPVVNIVQGLQLAGLTRLYPSVPFLTPDPLVFYPPKRRVVGTAALIHASQAVDKSAPTKVWATDGSVKLMPDGRLSGTAAMVGRRTLKFKLTGLNSSSQQVEMAALTAAHMIIGPKPEHTVLTDYLTAVRTAEQISTPGHDINYWRNRTSFPFVKWLKFHTPASPPKVEHVKAHTGHEDERSKLNDQVDKLAKSAHSGGLVAHVPPPTAFMPKYVCFDSTQRTYLLADWKDILHSRLQNRAWNDLPSLVRRRLGTTGDTTRTVDAYPLARSAAAGLGRLQLLLRTGQFLTRDRIYRRQYRTTDVDGNSPFCPHCPGEIETESHIFRRCPAYDETRKKMIKQSTDKWWCNSTVGEEERERRKRAYTDWITSLLMDKTRLTSYWFGLTGETPPPLIDSDARQANRTMIITTHVIASEHFAGRRRDEARAFGDPDIHRSDRRRAQRKGRWKARAREEGDDGTDEDDEGDPELQEAGGW